MAATRNRRMGIAGVLLGLAGVGIVAAVNLMAPERTAVVSSAGGVPVGGDPPATDPAGGYLKGQAYCDVRPEMCPVNPTTPTVVIPQWKTKYDAAATSSTARSGSADATSSDWTDADAARLEEALERWDCATAAGPDVSSQAEADQVSQSKTLADIQPILDEYWAPSSRVAAGELWQQGMGISKTVAGRHAAVECRIINFTVKSVRWDAEGLMAVVRYQTPGRFLDPDAGAMKGPDGWEIPQTSMEDTRLIELVRDGSGRILLVSKHLYHDPSDPDGGI